MVMPRSNGTTCPLGAGLHAIGAAFSESLSTSLNTERQQLLPKGEKKTSAEVNLYACYECYGYTRHPSAPPGPFNCMGPV